MDRSPASSSAKSPASGSRLPMQWNPFAEVWTGVKRIYRDRPLWLTVAGISYFWFLGALFQMTVILIGTETLHLSDTRTGLLVTALAVGIGVGSIAAGWLSGDAVEIGLVPYGAAVLGLCSILLGFAHSFASSIFWLAAGGLRRRTLHRPAQRLPARARRTRGKGTLARDQQFLEYDRCGACIGCALSCSTTYLRWTPSHILAALGVLTLAATVYIAWLVPAPLVRLIVWSLREPVLQNSHRWRGQHSQEGRRADRFQSRLLCRRHSDRLRHSALHSLPDVAAAVRKQMAQSFLPVCSMPFRSPRIPKSRCARCATLARSSKKAVLVGIFPGRRDHAHLAREAVRARRGRHHSRARFAAPPVIPVYLDGLVGPRAQPEGRPSVLVSFEAAARSDGLRWRAGLL